MKKLAVITGALILSTFSFAAPKANTTKTADEEIRNILGNYFKNDSVSLNVKEKEVKTAYSSGNSSGYTHAAIRDKIIEFAQKKLGAPYVWGATGPNSFDCSGFIGYVFKSVANLNLPRVSSAQATFKPKISSSNMTKGDLVFFETTGGGRISHVGIYMGNRQVIHASSGKSRRVMVSSLDSDYYSRAFRWAINPFS